MEQMNDQNPVTSQDAVVTPSEFNEDEEARPRLGFNEAVKICLNKSANFKGRARRSEFWWFCLFIFLFMLLPLIGFISGVVIGPSGGENMFCTMILSWVFLLGFALVFLVPLLAATTRRLHDTGRSGWWIVVIITVSLFALILQDFAIDEIVSVDGILPAIYKGNIIVWGVNLIILGLLITILVFTLLDSHKGENKYGPSLKYQ
jgi:uncharacterized membrane protein YhaH (DUF805 family)